MVQNWDILTDLSQKRTGKIHTHVFVVVSLRLIFRRHIRLYLSVFNCFEINKGLLKAQVKLRTKLHSKE